MLENLVDAFVAAGVLPGWLVRWTCWFLWIVCLNEVRLAVGKAVAYINDKTLDYDLAGTYARSWFVRTVVLIVVGTATARLTTERSPQALVVEILSQIELLTWVAGTVLKLPRKFILPLLGATRSFNPLARAAAGYTNGAVLWTTLGLAVSDVFALTPSSCRYLSVRAFVKALLGSFARGRPEGRFTLWRSNRTASSAKNAAEGPGRNVEEPNRPPLFLWLAAAAAWGALGASTSAEAAASLWASSLAGVCDSATAHLPFYDPRGWLCGTIVGEATKQVKAKGLFSRR